ncbi:MAG: DUF4050 domain-containing protein [Ruminococcaceae bacterium]|nr:DUF4050 domain-containing protein [Oscillospiraceae bacterium]
MGNALHRHQSTGLYWRSGTGSKNSAITASKKAAAPSSTPAFSPRVTHRPAHSTAKPKSTSVSLNRLIPISRTALPAGRAWTATVAHSAWAPQYSRLYSSVTPKSCPISL